MESKLENTIQHPHSQSSTNMKSPDLANTVFPEFAGKFVVFSCKNAGGPDKTVLIDQPRAQERMGRCFIVGEFPDHPDMALWSGIPVGLAWEDVLEYWVFNSIEDYYAAVKSTDAGHHAAPPTKKGWLI